MRRFWMVSQLLLPWDYFRVARHPPKNQRGPNAPGTDTITPPAETRILDV